MLTCQRDQFFLPDDTHYLNCAYMAPLARPVEEAGIAGMRRKRVPSGITAADFFTDAERARRRFARLVNIADPARVAIIPSASYGVAVAAGNLRVRRGQNVVIAHQQFPGNVYAWRALARREGLELRAVAPPDDAARRAPAWNERLLDAIDDGTAAVAIGHVHWTDGTRFDLAALGERARAVGAALIIDGTQSVGALPFDVERLRPDALVCAGYKWLLGPYSIGLAYFGPRFDGGTPLEETWIAREGSEDFRALVDYRDAYLPGAVRYDVGERSNFILLPMLIAALELLLAWGADEIQAYCRALTAELLAEAASLGFAVEEEAGRGAHLFGLRAPPRVDVPRLQALLAERRVAVSLRGSAIRVSPHVYNDSADVAALLDCLRAASRR